MRKLLSKSIFLQEMIGQAEGPMWMTLDFSYINPGILCFPGELSQQKIIWCLRRA